jgi:SAM-dependent methyltransferase
MTDQLQFLNEVAAHVRTLADLDSAAARSLQGDFPRSAELISGIETGNTLVGGLPPQPPTFRGRVGRALIGLIRRSLFWYTPTIHAFQRAVAAAFQEQNEKTGAVKSELSRRLSLIEKENYSLREQLRSAEGALQRWKDLDNRIARLEISEEIVRKEHLAEISNDLKLRLNNLSDSFEHDSARRGALAMELQALRENMAESGRKVQAVDQFTLSTRAEMMLVERRVSALLNAPRERTDSANIHEDSAGRPQLLSDVLYCDFESQFRGSEEEIKERVTYYLPRLEELGLGSPEMPIVDIGCGRGEWLDVLRERRLLAYGVDGNSSMIATCRDKGLAVEEHDGIQHLQSLSNTSVGAVTAFHFIEHLPFAALLAFIDEVLRVLKPGGLALFETPNPDNLVVGACTFYLDPTHQRPLPSGLLKFVMQSRGFSSIEVLALHPYPSSYHLDQSAGPAAQVLNERLYGCQDYAVLALKP